MSLGIYISSISESILNPSTDFVLGITPNSSSVTNYSAIKGVINSVPYSIYAGGIISNINTITSVNSGSVLYKTTSSGLWDKAYAGDSGSLSTLPAVAVAIQSGSASIQVLNMGNITNSGWSLTEGSIVYLSSTTPGAITQTIPTGSGQQVQILGVATTTSSIYFNPQLTFIELV